MVYVVATFAGLVATAPVGAAAFVPHLIDRPVWYALALPVGAAYAAGLATGLWPNLDELRVNWGVDQVFEPQWSDDQREQAYAGWKKAVERSRGWVEE